MHLYYLRVAYQLLKQFGFAKAASPNLTIMTLCHLHPQIFQHIYFKYGFPTEPKLQTPHPHILSFINQSINQFIAPPSLCTVSYLSFLQHVPSPFMTQGIHHSLFLIHM